MPTVEGKSKRDEPIGIPPITEVIELAFANRRCISKIVMDIPKDVDAAAGKVRVAEVGQKESIDPPRKP